MKVDINGDLTYMATGGVEFTIDQPCIMFLHGAAMDHTFWTLHTRYFARNGYRVLAPDLPGHGQSGGEAPATISRMAAWVEQLLDALAISEVILVGHSMGSLIALQLAGDMPQRVTRLALLGIAYPMRVGDVLLEAAKSNKHAALDMVTLYGTSFRSQLGNNPFAGVSVLNSCLRLLERAKPGVLFNDLSACNDYQDGEQSARNISCPVTVIVGRQDMMTSPKSAQRLASHLQNAAIIELERCGHMHPQEQPEMTHQALVKALSG